MNEMAKFIMLAGVMLCVLGAVLFLLGKIPGLGKMPGDIVVKREQFTFYFPVVTCIILSIVASILMQIFFRK